MALALASAGARIALVSRNREKLNDVAGEVRKLGEREHYRFCVEPKIDGLSISLLYERGELGLATLYVIASVALSIGGLAAGLALVRHFA